MERVTEVADEEEAVSQNQNLFTAKGAEDAKLGKGLPLIHTDYTETNVPQIDADEGGLVENRRGESGDRQLFGRRTVRYWLSRLESILDILIGGKSVTTDLLN